MPRLFVALTIPPDVAGTVAALVPPELPGLRRIAPELLHVTLAFLGATPEERVPAVVDAAEAAARGGAPFRIGIERVGRFPHSGRVRVVWAETAEGAEAILELGGRVREELERRRLPYDPKPLRPHVTLARVREDVGPDEGRRISVATASLPVPAGLGFEATAVDVMESVLGPRGPRYSFRARLPLGGRAGAG